MAYCIISSLFMDVDKSMPPRLTAQRVTPWYDSEKVIKAFLYAHEDIQVFCTKNHMKGCMLFSPMENLQEA